MTIKRYIELSLSISTKDEFMEVVDCLSNNNLLTIAAELKFGKNHHVKGKVVILLREGLDLLRLFDYVKITPITNLRMRTLGTSDDVRDLYRISEYVRSYISARSSDYFNDYVNDGGSLK